MRPMMMELKNINHFTWPARKRFAELMYEISVLELADRDVAKTEIKLK
ncbi:MAG: hypothetical protein J6R82_00070 [Clostridia bacterium]|nr:hypothetical protein [Clostridia bacterium]